MYQIKLWELPSFYDEGQTGEEYEESWDSDLAEKEFEDEYDQWDDVGD